MPSGSRRLKPLPPQRKSGPRPPSDAGHVPPTRLAHALLIPRPMRIDRRLAPLALWVALWLGLAVSAEAGELDRSFPAAGARTVTIALDFGSVAVRSYEGDQIRLEAVARGVGASSVHFDAHAEGRDVVLTGAAEPWVAWLATAPGVRVQAWVPRDTPVHIRGPVALEVEHSDHPRVSVTP